jgi:hypothetical protein
MTLSNASRAGYYSLATSVLALGCGSRATTSSERFAAQLRFAADENLAALGFRS